jgi:hypothetical protein
MKFRNSGDPLGSATNDSSEVPINAYGEGIVYPEVNVVLSAPTRLYHFNIIANAAFPEDNFDLRAYLPLNETQNVPELESNEPDVSRNMTSTLTVDVTKFDLSQYLSSLLTLPSVIIGIVSALIGAFVAFFGKEKLAEVWKKGK